MWPYYTCNWRPQEEKRRRQEKWTSGLNEKPKIIKYLEESTGANLSVLQVGEDPFAMTQNV